MKFTRQQLGGGTKIVAINTEADKKMKNDTRSNYISNARDKNLIFDDAIEYVNNLNKGGKK